MKYLISAKQNVNQSEIRTGDKQLSMELYVGKIDEKAL